MMRRVAVLIAGMFLSLQTAHAESTAAALKAFDILGTWSFDCASTLRWTYDAPLLGSPTVTTVSPDFGTSQPVVERIDLAERITEDKLRTIAVQIGEKTPLQAKVPFSQQPGERWVAIFEKVGKKMKVLQAYREDRKKWSVQDGTLVRPRDVSAELPDSWIEVAPVPLAERCLN